MSCVTAVVMKRDDLTDPAAGDAGHFALGESLVVGLSASADERDSELAFPSAGHAFASVATPALAEGIFIKDASADFAKVIFMDPALADGHDVAAVVEHEAVFICCLLYTSPSPRDQRGSRMPSSA